MNYEILKENAKSNRTNATDAEKLLWNLLRNKQLGEKFRRQHIIGDFIVDFISLTNHLIIEVDGEYHNTPEQQEADNLRTQFLNEMGFEVLRFTNEEVLNTPDFVISTIKKHLTDQALSPQGRDGEGPEFVIFTTRADTMFGVTFMVLAPESEFVEKVTTELSG